MGRQPDDNPKINKRMLMAEIDGLERRNAELRQENLELRRTVQEYRRAAARRRREREERAASPAHENTMIGRQG